MFQDPVHRKIILLDELVKVMKMSLFLTVTTAISERSFSARKRLTYMRSTITNNIADNKLNHLMVLHVHKKRTDVIDLIGVTVEFSEKN